MATAAHDEGDATVNPARDAAGESAEQRWPVKPGPARARHVPPRGPQPTYASQDDLKRGFYLPTPGAEFADSVSPEDAARITAQISGINEAKAQANVSLARWDALPDGSERQHVEDALSDLHRTITAGKERLDALIAAQGPATTTPTPKAAPDRRTVHTSQRDLADAERQVIRRQIGNTNLLAISGGRILALRDGIEMPVSKGYSVRVHLDLASGTHTVERIFAHRVNGAREEWVKGRKYGVSSDDLGEEAFRASCYVSYREDEW